MMHLSEDGHTSGHNMKEVCGMYNILSHTYVHLLVFISYLSAQNTVMDHLKIILGKLWKIWAQMG
jgi:hypothetical protein